MKGQTEALLAKATENLLASQDLLRSGHPEIAVSRSYYAMFYAAEGALVEEGLEFSSHGAVHGTFGERFAKTGRLDQKFHRYLLDAYRARQSADYDAPADISQADADVIVQRAREFIEATKRMLASGSAPRLP